MKVLRLLAAGTIFLLWEIACAAEPTPKTLERFLDAYQFEPIREMWASKMDRDVKAEIAKLRTAPGLTEPMRLAIDKYEVTALGELHNELTADKLRPKYATIFGKVFSNEEMIEITRFYESDTGKTVIRKRPQIAALIQEQFVVLAGELEHNLADATAKLKKDLESSRNP